MNLLSDTETFNGHVSTLFILNLWPNLFSLKFRQKHIKFVVKLCAYFFSFGGLWVLGIFFNSSLHKNWETYRGLFLPNGVNLIKLLWHKFPYTFCKLDHFINMAIFVAFLWKDLTTEIYYCGSNLSKSVSKFTPKKF